MLAISTSWNSKTHPDAREMLLEIKEAGFNVIEIGHNFTEERLEALTPLLKVFGIKVVSIHNFCPLPPLPKVKRISCDYYRLSSLDEEERKMAVEYTKRTIDTAKRVSAEAIVIHAGTVEIENNYVNRLMKLYSEEKVDTKEYIDLKQEFLDIRHSKREPHLKATTKSLEEIIPYSIKSKIKLGLENRYYPNEIPDLEEVGYFLELFDDENLGYWHDIGHAEISEKLGLVSHLDFLNRYSKYLLGMHLHDIKGLEDHKAPFNGEFDFSKITPYLTNDLIKVLEINSQATIGEIKTALGKLDMRDFKKVKPSLVKL